MFLVNNDNLRKMNIIISIIKNNRSNSYLILIIFRNYQINSSNACHNLIDQNLSSFLILKNNT